MEEETSIFVVLKMTFFALKAIYLLHREPKEILFESKKIGYLIVSILEVANSRD